MQGRLWTDGGVVTNQPIRPAVRLGADVLFLVMVDPVHEGEHQPERTFLDVGLRALSILVAKNLAADLKLLGRVNRTCEIYAGDLRLRPEEVQLEFAEQSYKYVKAFTICPEIPLAVTQLVLGLSIPTLLIYHVNGTRIAWWLYGVDDWYGRVTLTFWALAPLVGLRQVALVVIAWIHGCIGLHFWLLLRPWYRRLATSLLLAAIL